MNITQVYSVTCKTCGLSNGWEYTDSADKIRREGPAGYHVRCEKCESLHCYNHSEVKVTFVELKAA